MAESCGPGNGRKKSKKKKGGTTYSCGKPGSLGSKIKRTVNKIKKKAAHRKKVRQSNKSNKRKERTELPKTPKTPTKTNEKPKRIRASFEQTSSKSTTPNTKAGSPVAKKAKKTPESRKKPSQIKGSVKNISEKATPKQQQQAQSNKGSSYKGYSKKPTYKGAENNARKGYKPKDGVELLDNGKKKKK